MWDSRESSFTYSCSSHILFFVTLWTCAIHTPSLVFLLFCPCVCWTSHLVLYSLYNRCNIQAASQIVTNQLLKRIDEGGVLSSSSEKTSLSLTASTMVCHHSSPPNHHHPLPCLQRNTIVKQHHNMPIITTSWLNTSKIYLGNILMPSRMWSLNIHLATIHVTKCAQNTTKIWTLWKPLSIKSTMCNRICKKLINLLPV